MSSISRVDVAGLRAAAEAATPGPWRHTDSEVVDDVWESGLAVVDPQGNPVALIADAWYEADEGEPTPFHDAEHIAAADPTTVLALLDERDDLATRLATAEAGRADMARHVGTWFARAQAAEYRAGVAERQVQAVRDEHVKDPDVLIDYIHRGLTPVYGDGCEVCHTAWPCSTIAALDSAPDATATQDQPKDTTEAGAQ